MRELYADLPQEIKDYIIFYIDSVLKNFQLLDAANIIREFASKCIDEEEQEFIDFYFNLKLEEMQKEYI